MYGLFRIKSQPFFKYLTFMLVVLLVLTISRFLLSLWQFERVFAIDGWKQIMLQGLRVDIATLSFLLFFPLLTSTVFPISINSNASLFNRIRFRTAQVWLTLIIFTLLFMELTTPSFINEYYTRPNRIFIEYLICPKALLSMLLKNHLADLINSLVLCSIASWYTWNWFALRRAETRKISLPLRLISGATILILATIGGRSSLGHRPLNPAMVYFSKDPLVNSLILNSFYSTAFAAKEALAEESHCDQLD